MKEPGGEVMEAQKVWNIRKQGSFETDDTNFMTFNNVPSNDEKRTRT